MRLRVMILTSILVLSSSAAFSLQAAETEPAEKASGLLSSLLGETGIADQLGGLLASELPEGTDIDGMLSTLKEQLGVADSEIAGVVEGFLEKVRNDNGSYDMGAIDQFLAPILGQFLGEGGESDDFDLGDIDFEKLFAQSEKLDNTISEYVLKMNDGILESGDVQIVDPAYIDADSILDEDFEYMIYSMQYNYTEDDDHQLHPLCFKEDLMVLNMHLDEDENYTILDVKVPEEDNYDEFVEDYCSRHDMTPEDCQECIDFCKAYFPSSGLSKYMNNHPEITGIEYEGEIRTADELDEIGFNNTLDMTSVETEAETEAETVS